MDLPPIAAEPLPAPPAAIAPSVAPPAQAPAPVLPLSTPPVFVPVAPPIPVAPPHRSTRTRKQTSAMKESLESEAQIETAAAEPGMAWANDDVPASDDIGLAPASAAFLADVNLNELWIPKTYKEAMTRPDLWAEPIRVEADRLHAKKVWHLVTRPEGANIMKTMWVFDIKFNENGKFVKRKARLVAKGYTQIPGLDFFDTYASVVRYESLRMTLAIAASKGWKIWGVDFVSAYLNSKMKENVFMAQPEGMTIEGSENMICRLDFSLYGTMQGASNWWGELDSTYADLGYRRSRADESVRVRLGEDGQPTTITSTYTDDVTGISVSDEEAKTAKRELGERYDMTDLGGLTYVIGIKVDHDPKTGSISISQPAYCERLLKRYGMENCLLKRTPLTPGVILTKSTCPLSLDDQKFMADKPYRSILGGLMFLMIATRPDLGFAVNLLSSFASNPGPAHWKEMVHVLGYIRNTMEYKITYHRKASLQPVGYVDADYGGFTDTMCSTSGELYTMAGGLVAWGAHREHVVAMSTAESEYMSTARGARQMEWMYNFMDEVRLPQPRPALLKCDNTAAIAIAKSPKGHKRGKHIALRHHFVCEHVREGDLVLEYITSKDNIADMMTKPLPQPRHAELVLKMGLLPDTSWLRGAAGLFTSLFYRSLMSRGE